MTAFSQTPLMRHGALWGSDPWYRVAWLLAPQLLGLLVIAALFATNHAPEPPKTPGVWIHPIHSPDETAALQALRDRAVTDAGSLAQLEAKANAGNSLAQFYMGTLTDPKLHFLPPGPDNIGKTVAWYRKAADQGVNVAATNLGLLLMVGSSFGIDTDLAAARALFAKAAPTYPAAKRELGLMRQRGWGEPEDPAGGLQLIREAAESNDAFSQRLMAEAYDQGLAGLAVDPHEAVMWLQKAAAQGEIVAERELGDHLKTGTGTPRDADGALNWFRKAAEKGDGPAKAEVDKAAPKP